MTVCVTGATGFLGSALASRLESQGHVVCRSALRLGEAVNGEEFEGVEVVVHCAHDMTKGALERNVEGHRAFYRAASRRRHLFVSSVSARADAESEYGRAKYEIETLFLEAGETVVRPGLIAGGGGLFGRMMIHLQTARVAPLLEGGRYPVAIVALEDCVSALVKLIESEEGKGRAWNLLLEPAPDMAEVTAVILRTMQRRPVRISVPYGLAAAVVSAAERLGMRLPVTTENLRGAYRRGELPASHLTELVGRATALEPMIADAYSDLLRNTKSR